MKPSEMHPGDGDVDVIDEPIMAEMSGVNWHAVTEGEAASFGLAMSLYREQSHLHQLRRTAWGTATGSIISMCVLSCACMAVKADPSFTLGLIIATQALRALWLYRKSAVAGDDVKVLRDQAVEVARKIAELHPTHGNQ